MRLPVNVGVTFRDATVGLRESLTFPGGEIAATLDRLMARPELREAMVLCTCNRVELFAAAASGSTDEAALEALIAEWANALRLEEDYVRRAVTTRSDRDALVHALRVLASLDSLVVGEAQILGQVKEAYRLATAQNAVGPSLRLVFERGFQVAKRVRTETQLGRESVSISSVAVDLASQIFDPMSGVRVLLIGAGTMGELAARSLQEAGAESVTVVNRTHERAASLASRRGWVSRRFEDLENLYAEADVVITSTGSVRPVVHAPAVQGAMKRRRYRPLFFIDIAVPRDVASEVGELEQVYLYNIDDLEGIANRNLKTRVADVAAADTLVMEGVEAILRRAQDGWSSRRLFEPAAPPVTVSSGTEPIRSATRGSVSPRSRKSCGRSPTH